MSGIIVALIGVLIVYLCRNRRYRWIYIIIKTLRRDLKGLKLHLKLHFFAWRCIKSNSTVPKVFSIIAKRNPHKIAFYFEEKTMTFSEVDKYSNKIARHFADKGYKKGDKVALYLENCIEYPCIWLGLLKIGVNTALINTNLVKDSLVHSITTTECKSVIFGSSLAQAITDISSKIPNLEMYVLRDDRDNEIRKDCIDLRSELDSASDRAVDEMGVQSCHSDPAIYIFTSGTTGLPKAAVMTHYKCILLGALYNVIDVVSLNDVVYTPLPLYHTAGGLMGAGQALMAGITVAIRRKFSASQYFKDCEKYNATVAQYIGELCRYVLATPNDDTKHNVKTMIGNGLRPQIWKPFVERFGITRVFEHYGATEGASNIANIDNKEGSVGFIPRYFSYLYAMTLIKCDEETCEPIRNREGLCIECGVEEPGIMIGAIDDDVNVFKYEGYTDYIASERKILYDVFKKGDRYFNSGDILVYDELGYYYFRDRTGDTYRWKGENVSTSEVEAIISNIVQLNDVTVYGVNIPENEGNAGMAAIVDIDRTINIESIASKLKEHLPSYAVPIFIRVLDSVPKTGTFKLKKNDLRIEAYNIEKIEDPIYFLDQQQQKYVKLTESLYASILAGNIKI